MDLFNKLPSLSLSFYHMGLGSGYVLNFSDRTFVQNFAEELNIDIDNLIYARNGSSKAKRLRCFLQTVDKQTFEY
jgi:hypothetical protein